MSVVNADSDRTIQKILADNDTFLFDCDGVLWSTGKIFPGAMETVEGLRKMGKKVLYVTNNSTKTREQYMEKIQGYGINADLGSIFCTAYTSALYLKRNLKHGDKVYVVGGPAMGVELEKVGIEHVGIGLDNQITSQQVDAADPLDPKVKAVLAGMDGHFNYCKLTKAISYLAKEGSLFVATNMDPQFPLKGSEYRLPGTGALITAIITASEREPTVICGKPDSFMVDCIKAEVEFDPNRAMMIGDRLDTDILFGKNNSLQTLLMMSGVTSCEKLEQIQRSKDEYDRKLIPDYYLDSILDFAKYFKT